MKKKLFIPIILFILSISISYAKDVCLTQVNPYVDNLSLQSIEGAFTGIDLETEKKTDVVLVSMRCDCFENHIVDAINKVLENYSKYDNSDRAVCLKNVKSFSGEIMSADGFYIKEL